MSDDGHLRDRLALQDLAAHYARCVDRRDFAPLADLFVPSGRIVVYHGDPAKIDPTWTLDGVEKIIAGMNQLDQYRATQHVLGQQTAEIEGDSARGETYCMANHLHEEDGRMLNFVMAIRYQDSFVRTADGWRFSERVLATDWTEDRPVQALV